MKLAEALVMRKHLELKVKQLEPIKLQGEKGLFEIQTTRRSVNEQAGVDEIVTQVPKLTWDEVTGEYNKYSKALRLLDTSIQATNWATDLVDAPDLKDIEV